MTYVKVDSSLGFFFDPNNGITEINGEAQGENLYKLILTSFNQTKEITAKLFPNQKEIELTPVTLR